MPREKTVLPSLHITDYDIAGNVFRAWRDDDGKLVFVLDGTIDEFKPNVLLVIGQYDDRKWDDVLVNDYGIDLETVRPRQDNKYQKLDIEYNGLDIYARLIDEYEHGSENLDNAITELLEFRDDAARRAAAVRLNIANDEIVAAQGTIDRAERTLADLRERRQDLRARLGKHKKSVGREPTKQSAAKILRTESQIDEISEKMARAEKRIEKANRRIDAATADANAARELLARKRIKNEDVVKNNDSAVPEFSVPVTNRARAPKIIVSPEPAHENVVDDSDDKTDTDVPEFPVPEYEYEQRDEKMADKEEVKPLLDEDPEILDEEIAFKPVEFDDIKPQIDTGVRSRSPYSDDVTVENDKPVIRAEEHIDETTEYDADTHAAPSENSLPETPRPDVPVIDTIKTVEEPVASDTDTTGRTTNSQYDNIGSTRPTAAITGAGVRPLSPITGGEPPRPVGGARNRSSIAYYLLLVALIALSIFTLWLYQKKNGGSVPFLNAPADGGVIETASTDTSDNKVVGFDDTVALPQAPSPVDTKMLDESEVVSESEPEPDIHIPVVMNEPPIDVRYPNENILRAAEPDVPVVESEEDVLARKVAYDVAREDKPVYVPAPEPRVTNITAPDVIFDDDIVSVPVIPGEYVDEDTYYEDENMYYQNDDTYYDENMQYNQYVDNNGLDEPEPRVQRHLSIHDGGQYSIGYTEEAY